MKIFTGNSNPLLADSIAKSLGHDFGKIEIIAVIYLVKKIIFKE